MSSPCKKWGQCFSHKSLDTRIYSVTQVYSPSSGLRRTYKTQSITLYCIFQTWKSQCFGANFGIVSLVFWLVIVKPCHELPGRPFSSGYMWWHEDFLWHILGSSDDSVDWFIVFECLQSMRYLDKCWGYNNEQ